MGTKRTYCLGSDPCLRLPSVGHLDIDDRDAVGGERGAVRFVHA